MWDPRAVVASGNIEEEETMLRPLSDYILIERIEAPEMKGRLYIPEQSKERPQEGIVIATGPGLIEDGKRQTMPVMVGEKILFGKYSGNDVKLDDKEYVIMRASEVLGVLE